jgi:phosphoglycolate phosphatase-like HAD superfamily hydrolase
MQPPDAKLPRPVRAVVFDMDGLIFNTEDIYRDAVMATAADANHDVPLGFYLSTVGLTLPAQPRVWHSSNVTARGSITTPFGTRRRTGLPRWQGRNSG